jgi:hypothetical protein
VLYGPSPLRYGELFDHIQLCGGRDDRCGWAYCNARTTQLSMLGRNGEYARWEHGTYESEFRKRDGVWRIQAVRYYPRMATDYEKGWGKDAKPARLRAANFRPIVSPRSL